MSLMLTLQIYLNEKWFDAAVIDFHNEKSKGYKITSLQYINDFVLEFFNEDGYQSPSLNYPVSFFFERDNTSGWLCFLDDIVPSGASRRFWIEYLGLSKIYSNEQSYILLRDYALNPIGNVRIKESIDSHPFAANEVTFTREDVVSHGCKFLKYAQDKGARIAMATGAGGEAPKLLINLYNKKISLNTPIDELGEHAQPYLVKFPRGKQSAIDSDILRAEYHYYHELESMGFETISTKNMLLIEGANYPSLWLPRFDICNKNKIEKLAVESVYSMLEMPPGCLLEHGSTIRMLIQRIQNSHLVTQKYFQFDFSEFVIEWVKRDLINIVFGNSDNHGRNTSFLRGSDFIKLAPIYDFAPMKSDPEGVYRGTTWKKGLELGGNFDFIAIADSLNDLVPATQLLKELNTLAASLVGLKDRLESRGVPKSILNFPSIGFDFIEEKLDAWGLDTK
ncbi:type II toxin-antitoxin system HipA family toxin [Shewanella sp. 10N.286.51.B2]|uniref:type II toxin-antitoxin system HipA family toxin n=1 Tax=Shewanella sp. 10N.286.51.B2 TaxID=3229707 RepID=UPI00354C2206